MTTKLVFALIAAVAGGIALCAAGSTMMLGTATTAPCAAPGTAVTAPHATIGGYDREQVANATTIVSVGAQQGVPVRGRVIAVAVALQESTLYNLADGDRDSLGLFQQRPSQGWGSPVQLLDPVYASRKFYEKLVTVAGWQTLSLTAAAQQVQVSAYPDAYAKWEPDATMLVNTLNSGSTSAFAADFATCGTACLAVASNPPTADNCRAVQNVLTRAATWLRAWNGAPVPYLSSGDPADWFNGYRRDCSGYASMALGLQGPGLNTAGLADASTPISRQQLSAGDLLINTAPNLRGHVVIFDRWTDATMTSYLGYEQSGDGGTHHRTIPYPYFGDYPMGAYRFGNQSRD